MRPKDFLLGKQIETALDEFSREKYPLLGIRTKASRISFVEQIVESVRRIRYIQVIGQKSLSPLRGDPKNDLFDPLMAAVLQKREGQYDEAFWLVFLSVHFGKNRRSGWRLVRDVYGSLGQKSIWSWKRICSNEKDFREWLAKNSKNLKPDGVVRFGNHRKYQSLDAYSSVGTGAAIASYIGWVNPPKTHQMLIGEAQKEGGNDPGKTFDILYKSMHKVISFGRMAKFDYLTMLGKLKLAHIEPGSTFMDGATGPFSGAKLLFGNGKNGALDRSVLDNRLIQLDVYLKVGMQVLEDALCNWHKSPNIFKPFRG